MTVVGQNFVTGSVVRWNGSDLTTSNDGNVGGLTATVPASDVAKNGSAKITVFNPAPGGGSSKPQTLTITSAGIDPQSIAVDPAGKFAYVANMGCDGEGSVSMYTINPTSGALTAIAPPVPSYDELTDAVTVDPSGKFVYVASSGDVWDIDSGSIAAYAINPRTGALTYTTGGTNGGWTSGSPSYFNSLAVDPAGKFVYAADGGASPAGSFGGANTVSMFTINGVTGALTAVGTITAGASPVSVAVHPSGKFVYAVDQNDVPDAVGSVSMYAINAKTGALGHIGKVAAGGYPISMTVDPLGRFAYVTNFGGHDVSMYTVDATTGVLAFIGSIAAGKDPVSVAVDPTGRFVYVVNLTGYSSTGSVSMYTIDAATGGLTNVGTIATKIAPTSIAIHPSGKYVYVTNSGSNSVSMYGVDGDTGILKLMGIVGT